MTTRQRTISHGLYRVKLDGAVTKGHAVGGAAHDVHGLDVVDAHCAERRADVVLCSQGKQILYRGLL